ncbi:MAG: type II secretion system minor pseudopilin GspJ [Gammaproteobacteria bacterium]|nr:type II secretion system minor pseudopilin GspJ [Gammaproteobacteria bacterium]NNC97374.1 type II secretion system minor pseudopilin GspJ [Gammaproteobacteria bacterium]NNM13107.1 type II secretion system minor pseudopilin GspJ [Gammaproteobacteria bacterium]
MQPKSLHRNIVKLAPNISGFTLLEILLAVFIFALISIGAYKVSSISQQSAELMLNAQNRLRDVSISLEMIEKDFTQISARNWRDPFSNLYNSSLSTDPSEAYVVQLVRGGWKNPLNIARSELQLVRYRLQDKVLIREHALHVDNLGSLEFTKTELVTNVNSISLTFFDQIKRSDANQAADTNKWPPISNNPAPTQNSDGSNVPLPSYPLPIAVEIRLDLEDYGEISKIINLPPAGA